MARTDELRELLDYPNETLDVEYKSSLDLAENEHKASLARHIAALANHGGGKIVFGFDDDMSVSTSIPTPSDINRDVVSSIVRRYLDPVLQCDVHFVRSELGNDHPIVIVPAHGNAPVCAKASGPVKNGKATGILQGTHYIRKAGPCSESITSYSEWQPLIRRCAMHDRAALLSAIAGAIEPANRPPNLEGELETWHTSTRRAFEARLPNQRTATNVRENNLQFSYLIETEQHERLSTSKFERTLIEINNEVKDSVSTGWSMLYVFGRPELAPYWQSDTSSGSDEDFLECSLVDQETIGGAADFWRASPEGRVSLIRDFWEDSTQIQNADPYTRIDPLLLARSAAEIVRHAQAFAGRFKTTTSIAFRCEWRGLLNRRAQQMSGYGFVHGRQSKTNERASKGSWSLLEVNQHWERVVATLVGPVARSFGIEDFLAPEQIAKLQARWNL